MKKIKLKVPAKINLTLDVLGVKDGYHTIRSLVASVNVYDTVTLVKRKDKKITLKETGIKSGCSVVSNNAFTVAKAFQDAYFTDGVDIILEKTIPVGGGMGGSSADIVAVLKGMKRLYRIDEDVKPIADAFGSDAGYMIDGGWAEISGRGEKVDSLDVGYRLYLLLITARTPVSARECYRRFDRAGIYSPECTRAAVEALTSGDEEVFLDVVKNDLYAPAKEIVPEISENLSALLLAGAPKALMTGSGSAVYGIFFSAKKRNEAYKKLLPLYGDKLIKAQTL